MAHLERKRVVRRQYRLIVCLALVFITGIFPHSVHFAYAQDPAAAETVSISGTKIWVDQNGNVLPENAHPDSAELSLFANGVKRDTKTVSAADNWNWEFNDLPKYDENGEEISYTVREASLDNYKSDMKIVVLNTYSPSTAANNSEDISGDQEEELTRSITNSNPEFRNRMFTARPLNLLNPEENYSLPETPGTGENTNSEEYNGPGSENTGQNYEMGNTSQSGQETENSAEDINQSPNRDETPQTDRNRENSGQETNSAFSQEESRVSMGRIPESFSTVTELPGTGFTGNLSFHAKLNYEPLAMELEIPSLNVHSEIVKVPSADGKFPVEGLGMEAGLLEGTALPGKGVSILAAHNTLSHEEYGPFALIAALEEGERIFVRDADGSMMIFEVRSNAKIDASDVSGLFEQASEYEPSLTLLTCEDELLTGGYASRRIVSARKIN